MSRLEKKCLIVSAALHLLLMLVLFVGPAFLLSKNQANDLPVINVIPSKLVDDLLYGGGSRRLLRHLEYARKQAACASPADASAAAARACRARSST